MSHLTITHYTDPRGEKETVTIEANRAEDHKHAWHELATLRQLGWADLTGVDCDPRAGRFKVTLWRAKV